MRQPEAFSSPLFPDLDGDGSLEYFCNNHYGLFNYGLPSEGSYVYGTFKTENGLPVVISVDVDFTLTDNMPPLRRLEPNMEETHGFDDDHIENHMTQTMMWYPHYYDSHGGFIADLDEDGYMDLYMNNGAGSGIKSGPQYASDLYWGSPNRNGARWTLSGGAEAAIEAGLENHGGDGSGRSAYAADFDGDGLLDVLTENQIREDGRVAPGQVLYNNGDRTFTPDPSFGEYINVAIYANNGGAVPGSAADSLIIQRGSCPESAQKQFCRTHKDSSWVVYKYTPKPKNKRRAKRGKMSVVYDSVESIGGKTAKNIQTEDLNGDGIMDFMVVAETIELYYSSPTYSEILSERGPSEEIPNPDGRYLYHAVMRDFDLDGHMDIFAIYSAPPKDFFTKREYVSTVFSAIPGATQPPLFRKTHCFRKFLSSELASEGYVKDIASVDYNSDGFFDVVVVATEGLFFLTNTFLELGYAPNFLAVVLVGHPNKKVNRYAVGSSLLLKIADRVTGEKRELTRSVTSYSHGTTTHGGAEDHRTVFGLGSDIPVGLTVTWPNGGRTTIDKEFLNKINSMTAPLTIQYREDPYPDLGWWKLNRYSKGDEEFSVPADSSGFVLLRISKLRKKGFFHLYFHIPGDNAIQANIQMSTNRNGFIKIIIYQTWEKSATVPTKYKKLFEYLQYSIITNKFFSRCAIFDDRLIIQDLSKTRKMFLSKFNI